MAISRCSKAELELADDRNDFWRHIEDTCRYLLDLDLGKLSISTVSMLVISLENLAGVAPAQLRRAKSPLAYCLAGCRRELSRWIRFTTSQECLRSLEALDYRSLDVSGDLRPSSERASEAFVAPARPVKRYQFLYYLPHLLASLAVQSSWRLRLHASNRQFSSHVVGNYVAQALNARGEVVPGGRQRVSTVETMWVSRLLQTYSSQYWREQASIWRRIWRLARDAWDTFMNPRVAMFFVLLAVAGAATAVTYWAGANSDQFWISLTATFAASLLGSLVLGYFVSEKQRI
jgi:hypothetical protein